MTMTTLPPSPATELQPSIPQASNRSTRAPAGASTTPRMDQHALELEDLFDENSISSHTVTNSLNLERQV